MQVTENFLNALNAKILAALVAMKNNPKPTCEGFYVFHYSQPRRDKDPIITLFKVGVVPEEKQSKYQYFATKKAMESAYRKSPLSRNFAEDDIDKERYPGGIFRSLQYSLKAIGVSGHDSMVDEALALIYHHAENAFRHVTERAANESWNVNFLARIKNETQHFNNPFTEPLAELIAVA